MDFNEPFIMALEKYRQSASVLAHFKRYLSLLDPLPGQHVLDLGCGSGTFCRALAPMVSPDGRITGVDNTLEALRVASQLTTNAEYNCIRFEHGDGHRLMFADEIFASAVCISVLAFCDDPQRVLSELRRVVRPGGRLLVVNSDDDTRIYNGLDQDLGRRIQRAIADRTCDPWLGRRLAYLLEMAGFKILEEEIATKIERDFTSEMAGYVLAHSMRDYLLGSGGISTHDYDRWLADLNTCALAGSYCYGVTSYVYLAEV